MKNEERVMSACYGGCGRTVELRKSKVRPADYYLCQSKASGQLCEQKLPPLLPGKVRCVEINAAASFWGYTDQWLDAQTAASVVRAHEILVSGLTTMAIEKARQHK